MLVFNNADGHFKNAAYMAQYRALQEERKIAANAQTNITNGLIQGGMVNSESYVKNEAGILTRDFWREVDNQIIQIRDNDQGREFLTDLQSIGTPLNPGKTAKLYTKGTDISDEVTISMDAQPPRYNDHTDADTDGDPVPAFTAGFGVNWRHWTAMKSENIDLVIESQARKMVKVFSTIADYYLDGSSRAKAGTYQGQGIRNHRNTKKIDLGASGANINLVTATNDQIIAFYNQYFAKTLDDNYVDAVDVMWISPEIRRRLDAPLSQSGNYKEGTLREEIMRFSRIKAFKSTFKMKGNEFFAYVRNKEYISPLIGAPVSVVPVPRLMPNANYDFMIWALLGVQIKADINGRGGVFYAAAMS
ncbi:Uncharacterised protein [Yersinia aldovae]|uniref:major capsid protein n=1 Tax=Yersinia aldovae TaxID=29483 RepID=UPI0005E335D1|nr:major capsid protein [Yersinia aldovae]CNJ18647.1 Uncharacterised protein [Yersinia aldovae]